MAPVSYFKQLLVLSGSILAVAGQSVPLKLMPLGDSITRGYLSSDNNGYRNDLYNDLLGAGFKVDMVGSQQAGTMKDPDMDGFNGYRIDQIKYQAGYDVPAYHPNVIILNAGTNDCLQTYDINNAGNRLNDLLNGIFTIVPEATVILSTLTMNRDGPTEQRVETVNTQIRALADNWISHGRRVVMAEVHGPDGPQDGDLADGTHPNDAGYNKMATIYFNAIKTASAKGFIQP